MNALRTTLLLAAATLPAFGPALAQEAANNSTSNPNGVETVIVTGSLISRPGFQAPTPVTAVSGQDLTRGAEVTLADALNQLPQFGSATTSSTGFQGGGNAGANFINLRNLGSNRTLVLVNGERVVGSALTNAVDLNTLPTALIKRVDVVTGGASATYGSDAVAGVVNLVLDTNFTGVKASTEYSNNTQNAYEGYTADISVGTDFDNGRGHIVASASYFDNPNFYLLKQAPWNNYTLLVQNPTYTASNGQPALIHASNVGIANQTQGGVITSGPLANTQFVGSNAQPVPYSPGHVNGTVSFGGNGDTSILGNEAVGQPQSGYNFYSYASYRVASNILAHLELDYGSDSGASSIYPYLRSVTITADNPYIPAQTKAQMTALGVTSFALGTTNANLGNPRSGIYGNIYPNDRAQERGVFGLDGSFGDWTWSAYFQHGETHAIERWFNDPYIPNYNNAVDAVAAPAGNTAGIAPGTIVCRSTLTAPTNGCQPLDVFGTGVASPQSSAYIQPVAFYQINNRQDVAQVSIQGSPIDDWAGPVSIAGGGAYRSESADAFADALSYTRQYYVGNSQPFHGAVNVYEGFLETVVPLARNESWSQSMDFNAAGRITDYSTSGVVETWKLGLTDQVIDDVRLRATWSTDIRAPNLSELFTKASSGSRVIADPFHPGQAPLVLATTLGNADLKPEVAHTVSGGVVLTPTWLPGFSASFDWYSISLTGLITTIAAENELADCFAGQAQFCGLIFRNGAGTITQINSLPENTAHASTSGLDMEMDYQQSLWDGNIALRLLGNYTDESVSNTTGALIDNAGAISANTGGGGQPKFKSTITATYSWAAYSGTVQTRLIGSSRLVNSWNASNVDNNAVPWVGYLDLRGSYNFTDHAQVFFAVDNVLDTPPPAVPYAWNTGGQIYDPGSPGTVYDLLGRLYRVGIRVNY